MLLDCAAVSWFCKSRTCCFKVEFSCMQFWSSFLRRVTVEKFDSEMFLTFAFVFESSVFSASLRCIQFLKAAFLKLANGISFNSIALLSLNSFFVTHSFLCRLCFQFWRTLFGEMSELIAFKAYLVWCGAWSIEMSVSTFVADLNSPVPWDPCWEAEIHRCVRGGNNYSLGVEALGSICYKIYVADPGTVPLGSSPLITLSFFMRSVVVQVACRRWLSTTRSEECWRACCVGCNSYGAPLICYDPSSMK